ncbi:unnamed protein product, partial [Ectocarpus sp. 8 AP-2014]
QNAALYDVRSPGVLGEIIVEATGRLRGPPDRVGGRAVWRCDVGTGEYRGCLAVFVVGSTGAVLCCVCSGEYRGCPLLCLRVVCVCLCVELVSFLSKHRWWRDLQEGPD